MLYWVGLKAWIFEFLLKFLFIYYLYLITVYSKLLRVLKTNIFTGEVEMRFFNIIDNYYVSEADPGVWFS